MAITRSAGARRARRAHVEISCQECECPSEDASSAEASAAPAGPTGPQKSAALLRELRAQQARARGARAHQRAAKRLRGACSGPAPECPVCLEALTLNSAAAVPLGQQAAITLCGHAFHTECLKRHTEAYTEHNMPTLLGDWAFSLNTLPDDLFEAASVAARLQAEGAPCPVCRQERPMQHLVGLEPRLVERLTVPLWKQLLGAQFAALAMRCNRGEQPEPQSGETPTTRLLKHLATLPGLCEFMAPLPTWLQPFACAVAQGCAEIEDALAEEEAAGSPSAAVERVVEDVVQGVLREALDRATARHSDADDPSEPYQEPGEVRL